MGDIKHSLTPQQWADTEPWIKNASDEVAVAEGYYFSPAHAEFARQFIESYLYIERDTPFKLFEWQWREVIAPLFGWRHPNGRRRFRQAYISMARQNGKSQLSSGIALYLLMADGQTGASVFCAAKDSKQAKVVYGTCEQMVRDSPELMKMLKIFKGNNARICYDETASFLTTATKDADAAQGQRVHGAIIDELHVHPNPALFNALRKGTMARPQALIVTITTAGYDRNSICYEQYRIAHDVLSGVRTQHDFFAYIAEAEEDDDPWVEETWAKANPSMYEIDGFLDNMRSMAHEAQQSPNKQNDFFRYNLNQWTDQETRWLSTPQWNACAGDRSPQELEKELEGKSCYVALDMSSNRDITALALAFPREDGVDAIMRFWVPTDNAEKRERTDRVPYITWADQGLVELTEGNIIDHQQIFRTIMELSGRYHIKQIAYDKWNVGDLPVRLGNEGFDCYEFNQSCRVMNPATRELERLVLSEELRHGGHPVLNWMMGNVMIDQDREGHQKPSKRKSTERIDGVVALVMAIGGVMTHKDEAPVLEPFWL